MMKFTMDTKELKTMMEKGMAAIDKKASFKPITRLYFQVDVDGIVKVLGTDLQHYAEVRTDRAYQTSPGVLGIDVDDIKVISKMTGEITVEDVSTEKEMKLNIKCGKKNVIIPRYENIDIFMPEMDDTETKILSLKENWLLETLSNLSIYTSDIETNKQMQVFNFNTKSKRIEALDGYRVGMRTLENQTIHITTDNAFDTVKIHKMCVPVFKKIMDKKSDSEVDISQDKKYIRVEGKDFTYITRRIDGAYFNVDRLLANDFSFKFSPDRKNFLEAMKYDAELAKTDGADKKPVILHSENGSLFSYIKTKKYEAFDELETKENIMDEKIYIGFNPQFLADVFNVVDSENPECSGTNAKAPIIIKGNEYSFLLLPVNTSKFDYEGRINECINRNKVA